LDFSQILRAELSRRFNSVLSHQLLAQYTTTTLGSALTTRWTKLDDPMKLAWYLLLVMLLCGSDLLRVAAATPQQGHHQSLGKNWQLQSPVLVKRDGAAISSAAIKPEGWFTADIPTTVRHALVQNGIYPGPRFGLNAFRVPDASDEFN
jgi:hypothetical protein